MGTKGPSASPSAAPPTSPTWFDPRSSQRSSHVGLGRRRRFASSRVTTRGAAAIPRRRRSPWTVQAARVLGPPRARDARARPRALPRRSRRRRSRRLTRRRRRPSPPPFAWRSGESATRRRAPRTPADAREGGVGQLQAPGDVQRSGWTPVSVSIDPPRGRAAAAAMDGGGDGVGGVIFSLRIFTRPSASRSATSRSAVDRWYSPSTLTRCAETPTSHSNRSRLGHAAQDAVGILARRDSSPCRPGWRTADRAGEATPARARGGPRA